MIFGAVVQVGFALTVAQMLTVWLPVAVAYVSQ
jgi:hypothetical protein